MAHTYHALTLHMIFSTKDRTPSIQEKLRQKLHSYMAGIINHEFGITRLINGTNDHVHILADIKPRFAPADVMRELKANSSRWVHLNFPEVSDFAWQTGYGVFSVSHSAISDVRDYIANQEEHHRRVSFQEEFLKCLERHDIEYDPKYLWE